MKNRRLSLTWKAPSIPQTTFRRPEIPTAMAIWSRTRCTSGYGKVEIRKIPQMTSGWTQVRSEGHPAHQARQEIPRRGRKVKLAHKGHKVRQARRVKQLQGIKARLAILEFREKLERLERKVRRENKGQ